MIKKTKNNCATRDKFRKLMLEMKLFQVLENAENVVTFLFNSANRQSSNISAVNINQDLLMLPIIRTQDRVFHEIKYSEKTCLPSRGLRSPAH